MTKLQWQGSLKSHIDSERDEHMRWVKLESNTQAKKIMTIARNMCVGNKEWRSKKKIEMIKSVEDFQKQYESLFRLYEDFREEVKKYITSVEDDNRSISSSSSSTDFDRDAFCSPFYLKNSLSTTSLWISEQEGSRSSDAKETVLKDKLTSIGLDSDNPFVDAKSETEKITELRVENERLKLQVSGLESSIESFISKKNILEDQVKEINHQAHVQEEKLQQRISQLQTSLSNCEDKFNAVQTEYENEKKTSSIIISQLEATITKFKESETRFEEIFSKELSLKKKNALAEVREEMDCLFSQLDEKEEEIMALRKTQLKMEHRVREMQKRVEENEDKVIGVMEEKRDAIRELCVWVDYHRCRSDYYKKLLCKMNTGNLNLRVF